MSKRLQLHSILKEVMGVNNVYFQPPESVLLTFPCIVYSRGALDKPRFANDKLYQNRIHYSIILIDKNPDSEYLDKLSQLELCSFERHYTADNLNHDVFNIYY